MRRIEIRYDDDDDDDDDDVQKLYRYFVLTAFFRMQ